MLQTTATLIERHPSGPGLELTLRAPELARLLGAGRALLIKAGPGLDPTLRRTFYPLAITAEAFAIRIPPSADWGHAWLRTLAPDAAVDCLGPVGNGFSLPPGARNLLCVGEGEAAWALLPQIGLADALGLAVTCAVGVRTARESLPVARLPAAVEYHLVTADGRGAGLPALMSALADLLPWADAVCAAGSPAFYAALAETIKAARYGLGRGFAQALYPASFLCGVGACQACAADVAGGRRRVCLRGPVFDLADLVT